MGIMAQKRPNIFAILFGTGIDIETEDDIAKIEFDEEQKKVLDKLENKEKDVEKGFNNTSNNGGNSLKSLKVSEKTPKAKSIDKNSQQNLEKMSKILKGEKERD